MAAAISDLVEDWIGSPPVVYFQFQRALNNPESAFEDFGEIISADPGLSARLLRIVNSPFYGFESKVETITHALSIVGLQQLTELALASVVISKFENIPADLVIMEEFWIHSIACGLAAKIIASKKNEKYLEKFYLAGMLHDIGYLVLYKKIPDQMRIILKECEERGSQVVYQEDKFLGFNHTAVGGALLKEWLLPDILVESVAYHHNPLECENFMLEASIVHVADILVHDMKLGHSGGPAIPQLDANVIGEIELTEKFVGEVQDEVIQQVEDTVKVFYGTTPLHKNLGRKL